MHSNTFRAAAPLCLFLGFYFPTAALAQVAGTALPGATAPEPDSAGLPALLLEVPGGKTRMGLPVNEYVRACSQAAFPFRPEVAHRQAAKTFKDTLMWTASVIGEKDVEVETFYLSRWPIKNSEWQVYVDKLRAARQEVAPPLHWWRDGCPDDYARHRPKIITEFPGTDLADLYYLERHGHTFDYKLVDKDGKSIADHPVVFVTWRQAHAFAASIGMRLPTEAELTRAMRGDGKRTWPGAANSPDVFHPNLKERLGMAHAKDQRRKPVGTVPGAIGPYGHLDMHGQVWQMVGELGFQPINGMPTFLRSWKEIERHPTARVLEVKPPFTGSMAIVKGGSYLSHGQPATLMIDSRVRIGTDEPLKSVGFRLAKSLKPGFDYHYSLQRVAFDTTAFAKAQQLTMKQLVGIERYTLAANGFPSDYDAVAFAPVNWLVDSDEIRRPTLKSTLAEAQVRPLLIGALATTGKLANGAAGGLYSVFYRHAGVPKELTTAIKAGHRELVRARKATKKAKKQGRPRKWRTITQSFGLKDEDLLLPAARNGNLGYVYVDGIKVPTDRDALLLSSQDRVVAFVAGAKQKPAMGQPIERSLTMAAGEQGKGLAKLQFGIPLAKKYAGKGTHVVAFELNVLLAQPWQ